MVHAFLSLAIGQVLMTLITAGAGLYIRGEQSQNFHMVLGIVTALLTVFVHSVVLTYFSATSRMIKEACDRGGLDRGFVEQARTLKSAVMMRLGIGVVFILGPVITGALALRGELPGEEHTHSAAALLAMLVNLYVFVAEYRRIRANGIVVDAVFKECGDLRS